MPTLSHCSHQFGFSTTFVFELGARTGQTDGQTGKTRYVAN